MTPDIKELDLNYTVAGETNLIGYKVKGQYENAAGDMFAIMGLTLWAEFIDGIAVVDNGTETFTAVASPTGNPSTSNYFEKDGSAYIKSTDTTVVSGKTYYTRTVTTGA